MNRYILGVVLLILLSACGSEKLEDYRWEKELPTVALESATLNNYTLTVNGKVLNNGSSKIIEYGVIYNESAQGTPSHENTASKIHYLKTDGVDASSELMELNIDLQPETEYSFCFYAVNGAGSAYSEVSRIKTDVMDIRLMLPGTYIVREHRSFFYPTVYDDYEIEIVNRENQFYIRGLGGKPLEADAEYMEMKLFLEEGENGNNYRIKIPLQLTKLKTTVNDRDYPIYMLNAGWVFYDEETDIIGSVDTTDGVTITLPSGYAFLMCDPITHEIKLSQEFPPVEIVLGTSSFPLPEEDAEDTYPRFDCKLIRKSN